MSVKLSLDEKHRRLVTITKVMTVPRQKSEEKRLKLKLKSQERAAIRKVNKIFRPPSDYLYNVTRISTLDTEASHFLTTIVDLSLEVRDLVTAYNIGLYYFN